MKQMMFVYSTDNGDGSSTTMVFDSEEALLKKFNANDYPDDKPFFKYLDQAKEWCNEDSYERGEIEIREIEFDIVDGLIKLNRCMVFSRG